MKIVVSKSTNTPAYISATDMDRIVAIIAHAIETIGLEKESFLSSPEEEKELGTTALVNTSLALLAADGVIKINKKDKGALLKKAKRAMSEIELAALKSVEKNKRIMNANFLRLAFPTQIDKFVLWALAMQYFGVSDIAQLFTEAIEE